jgi:hypothetical protein
MRRAIQKLASNKSDLGHGDQDTLSDIPSLDVVDPHNILSMKK